MHELDDFLKHTGIGDEKLIHWGIRGMKWGFNDGEKNGNRTAGEEESNLAEQYDLTPDEAKELAKLIKEKKLSPKQIKEAVQFQKSMNKQLKENKGKSLGEQVKAYSKKIEKDYEKWKSDNPWFDKKPIGEYDRTKFTPKGVIKTRSPEQLASEAKKAADKYKRKYYSRGKLILDKIKKSLND